MKARVELKAQEFLLIVGLQRLGAFQTNLFALLKKKEEKLQPGFLVKSRPCYCYNKSKSKSKIGMPLLKVEDEIVVLLPQKKEKNQSIKILMLFF